jgi:hypothetical protein
MGVTELGSVERLGGAISSKGDVMEQRMPGDLQVNIEVDSFRKL